MRVASVCSGAGGLDLGLHRAGHQTVHLCEADPYRREVLARHWPGVPIHHDLTELTANDIPECDLLAGGTPCQDLSVSGQRAGLDGERSGLFHKFAQLRLDLYERHGTAWSLWENVAGALSSNHGQDFATVLASHVGADVTVPAGGWRGSGMAIGPWGTAEWRVLDAQYFGVPQRRRRVFVAGHLGAVRAVAVIAEPARSGRDYPQGGEARTDAPAGPRSGSTGHGGALSFSLRGRDGGTQVEVDAGGAVSSLRAAGGGSSRPYVAHTLTAGAKAKPGVYNAAGRRQEDDYNIVVAATLPARGSTGGMDVDPAMAAGGHLVVADTLRSHPRPVSWSTGALAVSENQRGELIESATHRSLTGGGGKPGQGYPAARVDGLVRRLTPTECERLMNWPDGWTLPTGPSLVDAPQTYPRPDRCPVDPRPDGRRYAACGDGVVAGVAEWIGRNISNQETA